MWEVRDAEEGEVHPSVRERERGIGIQLRGYYFIC